MPDSPYVHAAGAPRAVQPGGARVRFTRRQPAEEESDREERGHQDAPQRDREDEAWRDLLAGAVSELNASFGRAGVPFLCFLEEEEGGILLLLRRQGEGESAAPAEEEILDPRDLPLWLHRIRTGLGLLVDETA